MDRRIAMASLAALLAFSTTASLPVIAQTTSPADFILIRQDIMGLQFATIGGLKNAIDAKVDVKRLADRGDALARSGKVIPLVFPKGSETGYPTKALPSVWSDRAGFEKAASNLVEAAEKLAVLARSGDSDGFAAQWKVTGDTCSACHKEYRAK